MGKDIFEVIVEEIPECYYISDLRNMLNPSGYSRILSVVQKLRYEDYTVNQWSELIEYILHENVNFSSNKEAFLYFIQEIKNKH